MKRNLPKQIEWVRQARWASWWLSNDELFDFKRGDFDRKALSLQKAGVNAVITFGGFHCRWNFTDEWPRMLRMLRILGASCHRHGIRIVEHHSAAGVFNPIGEESRNVILSMQKNLNVDPDKHHGFLSTLNNGDAEYKGIRFSSMRQIDPRTGQFSQKGSRYPFCHNNPDWQRLYFSHLAEIYQCDVDGIMTDDVGFWGADSACGCLHCRKKFKKDAGFDIPPVGDEDEDFYKNPDSPANKAWILWRIQCHAEHQKRVYDHFRGLGLELARPMYCSSNTNTYGTRGMGVALDNLDGFYSTMFTEVNSTESQAHCWLRIGVESSQRTALARRNNVPPMCLFYPYNPDENLFCWAMTKTWGQNYWGTHWGMKLKQETEMLAQGFLFEKKHHQLYECRDSLADVGVLFSAKTVWLHRDSDVKPDSVKMSDPASTDCWAGWCETLMLANIPFDTFGENDLEEQRYFDRFRLIIVPNAVCLSDKALAALKSFVKNGGSLIVTHQSGLKDETGAWRKKYPFSDLVGAEYRGVIESSPDWIACDGKNLPVALCRPERTPAAVFKLDKKAELLMELEGGKGPAVFLNCYGKGKVMVFAGKPGRIVCVNRHKRIEKVEANARGGGKRFAEIDFRMNKQAKSLMNIAVRSLLPELPVEFEGVPEGFVCGAFTDKKRVVVHLTNAAGTLADSGKTVPIPARLSFPKARKLPGGSGLMLVKIRGRFGKAVLRSPEFEGEKKLIVRKDGLYSVVELPDRFVRCYSVIEIV